MAKSTTQKSKAKLPDLKGKPQDILLDQLEFDPANPRTVERLGADAAQKEIELFLLGGEMKARELVPSFVVNGFIPYEPLIIRSKPRGSKYVVVEGNRRLAALRSMRDSDDETEANAFARHGLARVPCLIFDGDERQLLAYLGLRHLSKTKDWTTAAKGAFVERVLRAEDIHADPMERLREAGRLTNTNTSSLRLTLLTRRLFDEAENLGYKLSNTGIDAETTFWHLGDAVRRSNTKSYLKLKENPDPLLTPEYDQRKFEHLVTWLYGNPKTGKRPIIDSIRDIPNLNECLRNDRALMVLESGESLQDAMEELEAAGAAVAIHLERAKKSVQRATSGLSDVIDTAGLDQVKRSQGELQAALDLLSAGIESVQKKVSSLKPA